MLHLLVMEYNFGKGSLGCCPFPSWNMSRKRECRARSRADPWRSSFARIIVCFALKRIDSEKLIRTIWKRFHEKPENPIKVIKTESILNNPLLLKNVETGNCVQIKLFQSNTAAGSSRLPRCPRNSGIVGMLGREQISFSGINPREEKLGGIGGASKGGMQHSFLFSMHFREKFLMEKVGKPWPSCPGIPVPGGI